MGKYQDLLNMWAGIPSQSSRLILFTRALLVRRKEQTHYY